MERGDPAQPLLGKHILVVDDEILIAMALEQTLRDAGADIISAATLSAALRGAEASPLSAAILDVHLRGRTTASVADLLTRRRIPFLFHSGYSLPSAMETRYAGVPVMIKPVRHTAFVDALVAVMKDAA